MSRFTFEVGNCKTTYNYDPTYAYDARTLPYIANHICYRVDYVRVYTNEFLLKRYPWVVQHKIKQMYENGQKFHLNNIIKTMHYHLMGTDTPWKSMEVEMENGNITVYYHGEVFGVFEGFYCLLKPGTNTLSKVTYTAIQKSIDSEFKNPKLGRRFSPDIPYNMTYMYGYERSPGWVNAFVADTPGRICTTNEMHNIFLRRVQCTPIGTLCRDIPKERVFQYEENKIMVCNDIIDLYDKAYRGTKELDVKIRVRYAEHHTECVKKYIKQYNRDNPNANLIIKSGPQIIELIKNIETKHIVQYEVVTELVDQKGIFKKQTIDHPWKLYGFYAIPVQTPDLGAVYRAIKADVYKIKGLAYELLELSRDQMQDDPEFEKKPGLETLLTLITSEISTRAQAFVTPKDNEFQKRSVNGERIININEEISFVYHGNNDSNKKIFTSASVRVINDGKPTYHMIEYPEYPYAEQAVSVDEYITPTPDEVAAYVLEKFQKNKK